MDVEFTDDVIVVQGSPFHYGSRKKHRFEVGDGSHDSHSSRFKGNESQRGAGILGIELESDGPAWWFGGEAEIKLLAKGIDLEDKSVGGYGKLLTMHVPIIHVFVDLFERVQFLHGFRDLESPSFRSLYVVEMVVGGKIVAQKVIKPCVEMPFGHFAWVLHFQSPGGCIAGIGKKRLLIVGSFRVQLFKHFPRHQYLPPDFKILRPVARLELKGDAADGLDVGCHVVSLCAVPTRDGPDHSPVVICDGDWGAVEFHFSDDLKCLSVKSFPYPYKPVVDLLDGIGIGQRHHRPGMDHMLKPFRKVGTDSLGRG